MRSPPVSAAALAFALAGALASTPAFARPTVAVTRVEVPARPDAQRLTHELRQLLAEAIKKASFGRGTPKKRIEVTARLTELTFEQRGDVLEVRCTLSGHIQGARGARSHITFGGRPEERAKLEHDVLRMVARGFVARIADIARADAIAQGD